MTRKEHIGSSIFILLASGSGLIFSIVKYLQPKNIVSLALDPYTLPGVVFACMFLLGIVRLSTGLKMPKTDEKGTQLKIPKRSILTALFIGVYVFLLPSVGFVITSFFYLWAQMFILQDGKRQWVLMAVISVVCSLGVYLMFSKIFGVLLPRGILTII